MSTVPVLESAASRHKKLNRSSGIMLIPSQYAKTVHFIRHAQGFHNVAGDANYSDLAALNLHDPHLTSRGWQQVKKLRSHLTQAQPILQVDLVVVSPTTRTLEAACGLFGYLHPLNDEYPLMLSKSSIEGLRTEHGMISKTGSPNFLADESCRERVDVHPCDKQRSKSYYQLNYPGVDFSLVSDDEDPFPAGSAESDEEFLSRTHTFLKILNSRPERQIAVVSHGRFFEGLFLQFGLSFDTEVKKCLQERYTNCEMRSVALSDPYGDVNSSCDAPHLSDSIAVPRSV